MPWPVFLSYLLRAGMLPSQGPRIRGIWPLRPFEACTETKWHIGTPYVVIRKERKQARAALLVVDAYVTQGRALCSTWGISHLDYSLMP
ncbi:hypothetical protein GGI35DRAFT_128083 [Trichoderma velutinum]